MTLWQTEVCEYLTNPDSWSRSGFFFVKVMSIKYWIDIDVVFLYILTQLQTLLNSPLVNEQFHGNAGTCTPESINILLSLNTSNLINTWKHFTWQLMQVLQSDWLSYRILFNN